MIVTTQTATYEVDDDYRWIVRRPRVEPVDYWIVAPLRKDEEPIPLIAYHAPKVGEPWQLVLKIRDDGIVTHRTTTPVESIGG